MEKATLKAIINAFHSASSDPTRWHISHVSLKATNIIVIIEACDGHIMSKMEVVDQDLAKEIGERNFAVSRESLLGLKAILKAAKTYPIVPHRLENGRLIVGSNELSGLEIAVRCDEIKFPDFDQLWPAKQGTKLVSIDSDLLAKLVKALDSDELKSGGITLEVIDELSPIVIKRGENRGIIMPMRI